MKKRNIKYEEILLDRKEDEIIYEIDDDEGNLLICHRFILMAIFCGFLELYNHIKPYLIMTNLKA